MRNVVFKGNGSNVEAPVRVVWSQTEIETFCRREDSLAPAMSLYAPGKQVLYSSRFVAEQQRVFREEISEAAMIYVIGMRVLPNDAHIWDVLAAAKGELQYVGVEPDEFLAWASQARRDSVHVLGETLQDALPTIRIQLTH
jgi:hypothetical protein